MKIFGIGLSKTGTHSLSSALSELGYKCIHFPPPEVMIRKEFDSIFSDYDAGTDITITAFYKELDKLYPNSKFILTLRSNMEDWLESCERHFKAPCRQTEDYFVDGAKAAVRRMVYGRTDFDRQDFIKIYYNLYNDVRDYFEYRLSDLLIMDIPAGDGWDKLCSFLSKEIPSIPFPRKNVNVK